MKSGIQHLVIKPGEGLRVSLLKGEKWIDVVDLRIPSGNELIENEEGDIVEGDKPRTEGHLFTYEIDWYGVSLAAWEEEEESRGGKSATPESEGKDNGNSN